MHMNSEQGTVNSEQWTANTMCTVRLVTHSTTCRQESFTNTGLKRKHKQHSQTQSRPRLPLHVWLRVYCTLHHILIKCDGRYKMHDKQDEAKIVGCRAKATHLLQEQCRITYCKSAHPIKPAGKSTLSFLLSGTGCEAVTVHSGQ